MTYIQDELFPPADDGVLWFRPVDRYGRGLPEIVVLPGDPKGWHAAALWAYEAAIRAEALGSDAGWDDIYTASTAARHIFYALTGDRRRLDLEFARHRLEARHMAGKVAIGSVSPSAIGDKPASGCIIGSGGSQLKTRRARSL